MDTIVFLDTYLCVNNTYWQSNGIIIFLCKYYIFISETLIGYWMYFSCCSLYVNLSEKLRRKDWVTEKSALKNLFERHSAFGCRSSLLCYFSCVFGCFLSYSTPTLCINFFFASENCSFFWRPPSNMSTDQGLLWKNFSASPFSETTVQISS